MLQGREHGDMNAAVWRRVTAAAIDFVIVPSVAMIVMLITGALENAEAWTDGFPGSGGFARGGWLFNGEWSIAVAVRPNLGQKAGKD